MRVIMIAALALATSFAHAQQIDAYRYWYDDASASATTITVPPVNELALNTALPTGNMAPGYHRFSLQVRDTEGNWSAPRTNVFIRTSGQVNGYRYWLNDDVANITTGNVTPGSPLNLNTDLALGTLTRHFNFITLQFKEKDGRWSVPYTNGFVRGTGQVNGYEYWIDDDIDARTANSIGPDALVDLAADLPMPAEYGEHVFTIRFSSEQGTWSVPLSSTYSYVAGIDEIPGITDVLLFPNPATDQLGLRLNSDANHTLHLEVLDLTGRRVLDLDNWNVMGSTWRNWDISGLGSGAYMLHATDGQGTWTKRFVKQ